MPTDRSHDGDWGGAAVLFSEADAKSRTFVGVRTERTVLCPFPRERFHPRGVVPFQDDGAHTP